MTEEKTKEEENKKEQVDLWFKLRAAKNRILPPSPPPLEHPNTTFRRCPSCKRSLDYIDENTGKKVVTLCPMSFGEERCPYCQNIICRYDGDSTRHDTASEKLRNILRR